METVTFDLVVLGAGPGGYPAAIRAAQRGLKVALVEAKEVGGTCLNRGCIPSKALIAGAKAYTGAAAAEKFGVRFDNVSIDYPTLERHKSSVVEKMLSGLQGLIKANKITLINGFGKFISPTELKVTGAKSYQLFAKNFIIATGSEPKSIPAFAFDHEKILDSTSLLNLKKLPTSLTVVGGGVIGCEFASLFASLGVKVTIVELLDTILATECKEISAEIATSLEKKGAKILTSVEVQSIEKQKNGVEVHLKDGQTIKSELALVSVGRSLNTHSIGLEKAGVEVLANGMVKVDDFMQTTAAGIYAVGDIASKWWLAHVATHQGIIAAENCVGKNMKMAYNAIPSVIFTSPEAASVGLTFNQALEAGFKAKIGAFPFQSLGKSQAYQHPEGFAQIVIDESTGQILGGQVVGYEASTLIAEIGLAVANELTVECLSETIHAHPTLAESWLEAALVAEDLPIHFPPKKSKK